MRANGFGECKQLLPSEEGERVVVPLEERGDVDEVSGYVVACGSRVGTTRVYSFGVNSSIIRG
jgi:hypothetical protein